MSVVVVIRELWPDFQGAGHLQLSLTLAMTGYTSRLKIRLVMFIKKPGPVKPCSNTG